MCLKKVLLSFDIEEFDLPREQGCEITTSDAVNVSKHGTVEILNILSRQNVRATFFCTTTFALNARHVIEQIIKKGHEIASHGCNHTQPQPKDISESKRILESEFHTNIAGFRQPRMFEVDDNEISQAGYIYNSSLHPAIIPGRYMHLNIPRLPFMKSQVLQIPASVTPILRLPVFWLACHNYPFAFYKLLVRWILNNDKLFVIYFHPWEFVDLNKDANWHIPYIIKRNSGKEMCLRLEELIVMLKNLHADFITYTEFSKSYK